MAKKEKETTLNTNKSIFLTKTLEHKELDNFNGKNFLSNPQRLVKASQHQKQQKQSNMFDLDQDIKDKGQNTTNN